MYNAKEKKEAQADRNKRIAELEEKNSSMRKRIKEFKAESKEKWKSFKEEFNHDMDDLDAAFSNLTKNNVK